MQKKIFYLKLSIPFIVLLFSIFVLIEESWLINFLIKNNLSLVDIKNPVFKGMWKSSEDGAVNPDFLMQSLGLLLVVISIIVNVLIIWKLFKKQDIKWVNLILIPLFVSIIAFLLPYFHQASSYYRHAHNIPEEGNMLSSYIRSFKTVSIISGVFISILMLQAIAIVSYEHINKLKSA